MDSGGTAVSRTEDISDEDPREVAQALLSEFGFGQDQFSCLDSLYSSESGWRINADNPSSSAYGIPQALPGSKMSSAGADWATNPVTQIRWGLGYIQDRRARPGCVLDDALARFRADDGGFHDTASDAEALVARPREISDNASPSGQSAMVHALATYAALTGSGVHREAAEQTLAVLARLAERAPRFAGHALAAPRRCSRVPRRSSSWGRRGGPGTRWRTRPGAAPGQSCWSPSRVATTSRCWSAATRSTAGRRRTSAGTSSASGRSPTRGPAALSSGRPVSAGCTSPATRRRSAWRRPAP